MMDIVHAVKKGGAILTPVGRAVNELMEEPPSAA
jgi:hypothetical protein